MFRFLLSSFTFKFGKFFEEVAHSNNLFDCIHGHFVESLYFQSNKLVSGDFSKGVNQLILEFLVLENKFALILVFNNTVIKKIINRLSF